MAVLCMSIAPTAQRPPLPPPPQTPAELGLPSTQTAVAAAQATAKLQPVQVSAALWTESSTDCVLTIVDWLKHCSVSLVRPHPVLLVLFRL